MNDLRQLPSVDQLMNTEMVAEYVTVYGRTLTTNSIRAVLNQVRANHQSGHSIPAEVDLIRLVEEEIKTRIDPTLQPVINATGVILHTNLGRSPLSGAAIRALDAVASGYSTLEYDLASGRRGSRNTHAEDYLVQLTGAEAAFVVNNNAAAVLLILSALSKRRKVLISRSQLVEIGGGFRVPDVMNQSGAKLFEIGTTNRVHLYDYQRAIEEESIKLVMRAHRSNFQIVGFTSEPPLADIVAMAHQAGIPVMDDLGSGALLDTSEFGLGHEPTVQESLDAGVDLVCFSGDKLLGGPQAGIILGNAKLIARLKKHPLARAIRADKLCLAALAATLVHYLKSEALSEIPIWNMISQTPEEIHSRAIKWVKVLGKGELIPGRSTVGGGSLPGETLPTWLVAIKHRHPNQLQNQLRQTQPPIIARIDENQLVLDPRTVIASQEKIFLKNLSYILNN
ncbi:MAG: L-seryl-tRNA(Sec) selenium transferase [Anaerolineales bacterium]